MTNYRVNDVDSNTFARFPVTIVTKAIEFDSTSWSTPVILAQSDTDGVFGYSIVSLYATNTDTVGNNLIFYIQYESNTPISTPVSFCPVAAGAGTDFLQAAVPVIESDTMSHLSRVDNNGNSYIPMDLKWKLLVKLRTALSSGKKIAVVSTCNYY